MSNIDWQTHLAVNTSSNLSIAEAAQTDTLCDLSHLGLLKLSGADAVSFLQGQVTHDVSLLNGTNAQLAGYCNPKGRMLALFLSFAYQDALYLQFDHALLAAIHKRLNMYVLRAKVQINDVSTTVIRLGINGPNAASILAESAGELPAEDYQLRTLAQGWAIKLPSVNGHRYELFAEAAQALEWWNLLAQRCQVVNKDFWNWLDIQSGIPEVNANTQEAFVPQMLNLDLLNGISFKKGCYTGQEIVARTHYLGTVKRRTYLAHIDSPQSPLAGDKITDAEQQEVGQLVRVAPSAQSGFDVLVELRIEAKQANQCFWQSERLRFGKLAYLNEA